MERQPTGAELAEAHERGRADAEKRDRDDRARPSVDRPLVEESGPYEFAPEAVRAEYERAYEDALRALRRRS